MSMPWFLELLALPPHADDRAVRRAYAMRLKLIDPTVDPAAFARLREAYEAARAWAADEDHVVAEDSAPPIVQDVEVEPPTRPTPAAVSPQEQATRLIDRFAARIAGGTGQDIQSELDTCTAELRLQYIDAPGIFEEVLIDRLARGLIAKRPAVFALATEQFHWQEIGHVASLGPKGLWIEAVESQRMAWDGLAPRVRAGRLSLIEQADAAASPLPMQIVKRWFEVRDDFRRYPAYLGLYLAPPRQREWATCYEALPASERQTLEAPVRKRRWRLPDIRSTYPAWGFLFLVALVGIGHLTASLAIGPQPDTVLDVRIDPHRQGRANGQAVISVTLRNMTAAPVYAPKARTPLFTPEGHLMSDVFDVVDELGTKAAFIGRQRRIPTGEPGAFYGTIEPGETRQHDVDLSIDYQLAPGHLYKVSYVQPVERSIHPGNVGEVTETEERDQSNRIDIEMPADAT